MSINDVIVYVCNENCENKNSKAKIVVPFICSSFTLISTLIFHFHQLHLKNKTLSRITDMHDSYWHKLTKVVQKVTNIVGNKSLVSLITWLNFHKIQNFICIQTCDRLNFKKPERKHTFMSTHKGGCERGS